LEHKLEANKRVETGKGVARRARARGEVPAVVYGLGEESVSLTVRDEDLTEIIRSEAGLNVLLDLQIADGRKKKKNHLVMIKELQKHPVKKTLLHVDFLKVARDTMINVKVPISLTGEEDSKGLKYGGTLQHNLWEVEVECLPTDVPDRIIADISQKDIGDHLAVVDLVIPPDVTVLAELDDIVLSILAPRLEVEEEAGEEEAVEVGEEGAPAEKAAESGSAPTGGQKE